MNTFYMELKNALECSEGDIWAETVLTGDRAGEKQLLVNPEKDRTEAMREFSGSGSGARLN